MKAVDFLGKCREKFQYLLQRINSKISGLSMLCLGSRMCGFTVSRLWLQNAVWMVCAVGFLETCQHFFSRNTRGNRQGSAADKSRGFLQSLYARMWQFYYNGEKMSQSMEEKPNWFCLAAACKLELLLGMYAHGVGGLEFG